MPSPVYTTRFSRGDAPVAVATYTVPAGKRAVVRFLSVQIKATATGQVILEVAGATVIHVFELPEWTTRVFDLRAVATAGETIKVTTGGGAVSWHCSGYLFTEA